MNARRKLLTLIAGAAAALAVGSIAFAAIPDGGGVIHGCYDKQSGLIRVTDTAANKPKPCTSSENALDWNKQGPQGVQGVPGPQGPKGDVGPSDAYVKSVSVVTIPGGGGATTVASLDLPAGKYLLSAKLSLQSFVYTTDVCKLETGGAFDFQLGETRDGGPYNVGIPLAMAHEFATAGEARLTCSSDQGVTAKNAVLSAIKVANLTTS